MFYGVFDESGAPVDLTERDQAIIMGVPRKCDIVDARCIGPQTVEELLKKVNNVEDVFLNPVLNSYEILWDDQSFRELSNMKLRAFVKHAKIFNGQETIIVQLTINGRTAVSQCARYYDNKNNMVSVNTVVSVDVMGMGYYTEELGLNMSKLVALVITYEWLMKNKPEIVISSTRRSCPSENLNLTHGKKKPNKKKVLVQKVLRISKHEIENVRDEFIRHHNITCPCWGVIGHWRTCKSGKRVWIKPHVRGKFRDAYESKEYQMPSPVAGI